MSAHMLALKALLNYAFEAGAEYGIASADPAPTSSDFEEWFENLHLESYSQRLGWGLEELD